MYKLRFSLSVYKETETAGEVALVPTGEKMAFAVYAIDWADVENKDEFFKLIAEKMAEAFTEALRRKWGKDGSD